MTFEERYLALQARLKEDMRRRNHDRIQVVVTMLSEPAIDEPADYLHVQIKKTRRLRELMDIYRHEYSSGWGMHESPHNFSPEHGPQLTINEEAFEDVLSWHWTYDRHEDLDLQWLEGMIDDFVHRLTGYYTQIHWRRN